MFSFALQFASFSAAAFLKLSSFTLHLFGTLSSAITLNLMLKLSNGVPTVVPDLVIVRPKSYPPELILCSLLTGMLIAAS